MDWQQTTLNRAGGPAFVQWIRTAEDQRDMAVVANSVAAMEPVLDLLERHFAAHEFIAEPHFTMADIPVACEVHRWFALPQPRKAYPALERWFAQVLARPATRGVLDLPLS